MKNKNNCDEVLKKNEVLFSKLIFVLKENVSLKNKIISISKELDLISNENKSLKNDLDSHVCHARVVHLDHPLHAPLYLQLLKMI